MIFVQLKDWTQYNYLLYQESSAPFCRRGTDLQLKAIEIVKIISDMQELV